MIRNGFLSIILLFTISFNIFALTQKEQEFFNAIKENKYESQLKNLLRYKMDLNATNEKGLTPLLYAIECGNEKAVRVLLEYSDVNIEAKLPDDFADYPYINKVEGDSFNIGGATPLMFAIFKNNARIVKQLIDKNADLKARDNEGTPVFLYACGFGNGNIIRMLLVKDRNLVNDKTPNADINGLHYAASLNNSDTINFLVKNVNMNINDRDSNGCTALYYAAYYAKKEAYNLLIKLGANKDIGDNYGVKPEYILSGGSSAVDLGADKVIMYTYEDGKLEEASNHNLNVVPGSGPRHMIFSKDGRYAYLVNEIANNLMVFKYSDEYLNLIQVIHTTPRHFHDFSSASAIRLSDTGNHLFVSNRGHDSIVLYRVNKETGKVSLLYMVHTGRSPRDFNIIDNKYLIVGAQDDDEIELFTFDEEEEQLVRTVYTLKIPAPVCIAVNK